MKHLKVLGITERINRWIQRVWATAGTQGKSACAVLVGGGVGE